MVTGGYHGGRLASTEILLEGASQWVYSGALPSAAEQLKGATIANKLIIAGINRGNAVNVRIYHILLQLIGGYRSMDDILEWDPTAEEWKHIGNLNQGRRYHAMDIVDIVDVIEFCIPEQGNLVKPNIANNKFALLWGEAQLCLPYVCIKKK